MKLTSKLLTSLALFTLLPTAAHAASGVYVVSAGDTLSKIAREHQTTVSQLMQVNQLKSDQLSIGQTLSLPEGSLSTGGAADVPLDVVAASIDSANNEPEELTAGEKARVTVDVLNVRKKASTDARILGKLKFGDVVEVVETGSEWTKIEFEDDEAYVFSAYLSPKLTPDVAFAGDVDSASLHRLESIFEPLLKTPYVLGGTTPDGFDCSGFTSYVFSRLGVTLPRTSEDQFRGGVSIPLEQAQPGDLLFYDSLGKGRVSHVAIYLGNGTIVHANGEDVRYGKVEYMHKLYPFYGVKRYAEFQ
ncbi:C40 family peptidase [Brevibacillus agri]|uniref:C40 family peptidase n=1 Tax=Brevibacillus agri TaxID=51101 RepID=UPI0024C05FA6|nr:C40 family peptidase [Brevibacillus agri]MDR9503807.1 NlpC/P60 family protein [Brevibacillus agri]MED4569978.1 NlpC/P60 family protein [Brevibacillus agri]WHX33124.1 NlpC/P60 family protein [Brevibacillus agri]